jgi:APA family basic amino acid/polyamine antiporter
MAQATLEATAEQSSRQAKQPLSTKDLVGIVVGIVIGAGIFETPSLVAAHARSELAVVLVWIAGGVLSLLGALCYAELASTYPNRSGSYLFLKLAYGNRTAFLLAWARLTVIQTGSIALLGFVFGDYATQVYSLGPFSASIYAALAVLVLTALNVAGL